MTAHGQSPKVSVIIPTYNYAHFLPEAIQSVLAQTFQDFELFVVDDGSTDNTREVVAGFGRRVNYIYQKNKGYSAARNVGIRLSQGEVVAFLDADDTWLPEKLEVQVAYLDNHPEVGIVYSHFLVVDRDGNVLPQPERTHYSGMIFERLLLGNFIGMPTVAVRRECFAGIGPFDESLRTTADWELWLRLTRKNRVGYMDQPLAKYRLHGSSMHRNIANKERDCFAILDKVFSDPELPRGAIEKKAHAYSNVHALLGWQYYASCQMRLARKHFFEAIRLHPYHLFDPKLMFAMGKSFLGARLVRRLRQWKKKALAPLISEAL